MFYVPVYEEISSTIILLDQGKKKVKNKFKVVAKGCMVKQYKWNQRLYNGVERGTPYDMEDVEVGDVIYTLPDCDIPIEYDIHRTLMTEHCELYRGRREWIIAKETRPA